MKQMFACCTLLFLLLATSSAAWAETYEEGLNAYDRGEYAQAAQIWRELAEAGDAHAQGVMGIMYSDGTGVAQDLEEALKWFQLGAQNGDPYSMERLGTAYHDGLGTKIDYKLALHWLLLAAQQNRDLSQYMLGNMYKDGEGAPPDKREAVRWYTSAAKNGNLLAQDTLGWAYMEGDIVPQNYKLSLKWFTAAAEQGYAPAMYQLGRMYGMGLGGAKDNVSAHVWFNLAVSNANDAQAELKPNALKGREITAKLMTPQQLEAAQERASKWKPKESRPAGTAKK